VDKNFSATFTKCPACGSESRLVGEIAEEMKKEGLARQDWKAFIDIKQGVVIDKNRSVLMPIGKTIDAGYVISTDVCIDCGCFFAVEIMRVPARFDQGKQPYRAS
jgi:hypothetical protein